MSSLPSGSPSRKRTRPDDDILPSEADTPGPSGAFPSSPPLPPLGDGEDDDDMEIRDEIEDLEDLEEEMEGEDLMQDMEKDYTQNLVLDQYDDKDIDDEDYDDLDPAARRALEAKLNRRDKELAKMKRMPKAFLQDDDDEDLDLSMQKTRTRHAYDEDPDADMMDVLEEELSLESLGDVKAPSISEWIAVPAVHRTIAREFRNFLLEYTDEKGTSVYGSRITALGEENAESLEVNWYHLTESKATLAYFLANAPTEMLQIFDAEALKAVLINYPDYERIHPEIHVRITDIPFTYTLRELRQSHLNSLVRVSGVVTRRTGVFPQLKHVKFNCVKCGAVLGPFQQEANVEVKISYCQDCQSKGPFTINSEKTLYRNYQKITLQESPGTVPAGRLPRHREVILLWDLIDKAKPGEEVEIVGIYRNNFDAQLNNRNGFPVFATILEANHVVKAHDQLAGFRMTPEDEKQIRALSKDPQIIDKIIDSIAPSIYGHRDIKTAIACSLFGGVPKDINGKLSIRGDINVLILGDPGTAKSQFLKYVEKTAHRAVFATGQGASAVGLTASVRRDPITNEWTLEGGALVLADKGTCLIDEFDKMNDKDRTSIHEAMEQQSISISKAGIVTTLQARCAVIAAANPIGGKYNSSIPFQQNVELTEPILSRFDVLCVVRDTANHEDDARLAQFVVNSHGRSHPVGEATTPGESQPPVQDNSPIPQELLRKYILYSREHVRPKLTSMDEDKVARLFVELRQKSARTGSFPITVRHLEAIIRLSESFAKMRLSEFVSTNDIDMAIKVTIESFVGAQKNAAKRELAKELAKYMITTRKGGKGKSSAGRRAEASVQA